MANPVEIAGRPVTVVDRSGTIAAGGTAQQLVAASTMRAGLWVQNISAGDLWVNENGAAAASQPSLRIPPGAVYEWPVYGVPVTAVSIFGATTAQAFSAREC